MRHSIVLFVNGNRHEVAGSQVLRSLSDWLRQDLRLVGTKIVCSEGDCGACTVLVGRLDPSRQRLKYVAVDSCLLFLFQLDGTHVVTIEGISQFFTPVRSTALTMCPDTETVECGPGTGVQQAVAECHASQCGFCTPGFVMMLTALLEEHDAFEPVAFRLGLTGNLCRCTGYIPILEAAAATDAQSHSRIDELFPDEAFVTELKHLALDAIQIEFEDRTSDGRSVINCPRSVPEALAFLDEHPKATIVAGGTDLGVRINKGARWARSVLDLSRIEALSEHFSTDEHIVIGASTTWTELLTLKDRTVRELREILLRFGSPQIRNVGTIGGNIVNGSPIADALPMLCVAEATLELSNINGSREVGINEFYLGYKKMDLRPGELLTRIRIPHFSIGDRVKFYKVSRRRDLDIASFTAAIRVGVDGDRISSAAVALGAVGPTVLRCPETESFLVGKPFTQAVFEQAGQVATGEIAPISDVRGARDYRQQLTRNIFVKFYFEFESSDQATQIA